MHAHGLPTWQERPTFSVTTVTVTGHLELGLVGLVGLVGIYKRVLIFKIAKIHGGVFKPNTT